MASGWEGGSVLSMSDMTGEGCLQVALCGAELSESSTSGRAAGTADEFVDDGSAMSVGESNRGAAAAFARLGEDRTTDCLKSFLEGTASNAVVEVFAEGGACVSPVAPSGFGCNGAATNEETGSDGGSRAVSRGDNTPDSRARFGDRSTAAAVTAAGADGSRGDWGARRQLSTA